MKSAKLLKIFVFAIVFSQALFVARINAADELPPLISMDLQDASLNDVLKILSIQSKMNFIASEAVKERKLTLFLDKIELSEALDKIFKANNLTYEMNKEGNIIIVKDWGKPQLETETKVFYLKHASVSTSSLKEEEANTIRPLASTDSGSSSGSSGGSSGSSSSSSSSSSSGSSSSSSSGKWGIEEEAGITQVVKKLLSDQGSVIEDFRTNSLIVTDVPSRMVVIERVIVSLDIAVTQVMLEVEMLDVSKNIVDTMGIKYGQTPLSVAITGAQADLGFPYGSWMKVFATPPGSLGKIDINNTSTGGGSYKAQLDWLSTQTDTKFLARPRILTLNNETAEIKIVTDEAIGVTSVTEGSGSSSQTTATAERFQTGVTLRVTPQIDKDTNEITMFIYPQVSEASTQESTFYNNGQRSTFRNPEVRSTKTTVRIRDGETVVLGGLIRNQKSTTITKLPVLGDIPLIGGLFRHKQDDPDKQRELLVFITPHIVKNGNAQISKPGTDQKISLPLREQAVLTNMGRQQSIGNYLSNFEKQR